MNKAQKWLCGVSILAICFMLTGCHMKHEWQEATCTTPKTCMVGNETEGEALGHTWVEATCSEPKHCGVCEETEGNALEHSFTEANYQEPSICLVCSEIGAEPLTAGFDKLGIAIDTVLNETYPIVAQCYSDTSKTTVGKVTFSDLGIQYFCNVEGCVISDCDHEKVKDKEGREVSFTIVFDDEIVSLYGVQWDYLFTDYYLQDGINKNFIFSENEVGNTLNWYGAEYSGFRNGVVAGTITQEVVNEALIVSGRMVFVVPPEYDGAVLGIVGVGRTLGGTKESSFNEILEYEPVFFRLK